MGGYGLPEFRAVVHREIGAFASEWRHYVRYIADQRHIGHAFPSLLDRKRIDRARYRLGGGLNPEVQLGKPVVGDKELEKRLYRAPDIYWP